MKIFWRGKLIFVRHRTKKEIEDAQNAPLAEMRDPQPDQARVKEGHSQWLVVYGNCTHLGCVPLGNEGPFHGWFCPCHGSVFDTSGRIRQGRRRPTCRSRLTPSFPTPRSRSVEPRAFRPGFARQSQE